MLYIPVNFTFSVVRVRLWLVAPAKVISQSLEYESCYCTTPCSCNPQTLLHVATPRFRFNIIAWPIVWLTISHYFALTRVVAIVFCNLFFGCLDTIYNSLLYGLAY